MNASKHLSRVVLLLALLVSCATPSLARAVNNCTGGGRPQPDDSGIGGTGARPVGPGDDDSGVGGTGISANGDTGIIGTITGFASICVGETEIHYDAQTVVQIDGQPATSARLGVGQVAEVIASGSGSEMSARRITVNHVVVGPVTRVDPESNQIDVIGQTVQLSSLTRGGDQNEGAAEAGAYTVRSFVQVSGMRRADGVVVASRVTRIESNDVTQLVGPVTKLDPGMLTVGNTPVRVEGNPHLALGDEVRVVGVWDGKAVATPSFESIPRLPFDGRVARLDIEGFAHQAKGENLQVGPFAVELPAAAQAVPADTRIRIQAVVENRHVIVEHVRVMDELPSLPPLPPRNGPGWNGGRPSDGRDGFGGPPMGQQDLGERQEPPGHDNEMLRSDGAGGGDRPPGPGWGDRPGPPQMPDHPPGPQVPDRPSGAQMPDRPPAPQVPDRPQMPVRPDHPPVPQRPERPFRPERPPLPMRPELPGRP